MFDLRPDALSVIVYEINNESLSLPYAAFRSGSLTIFQRLRKQAYAKATKTAIRSQSTEME